MCVSLINYERSYKPYENFEHRRKLRMTHMHFRKLKLILKTIDNDNDDNNNKQKEKIRN
jgi:hypothetical protein